MQRLYDTLNKDLSGIKIKWLNVTTIEHETMRHGKIKQRKHPSILAPTKGVKKRGGGGIQRDGDREMDI